MSLNLFDAYNLRARTSVVLIYAIPYVFDILAFCGKGISAVEGAVLTVMVFVFQHLEIWMRITLRKK